MWELTCAKLETTLCEIRLSHHSTALTFASLNCVDFRMTQPCWLPYHSTVLTFASLNSVGFRITQPCWLSHHSEQIAWTDGGPAKRRFCTGNLEDGFKQSPIPGVVPCFASLNRVDFRNTQPCWLSHHSTLAHTKYQLIGFRTMYSFLLLYYS